MKYNNLTELFTAIADSIRGKTGGSDKIPAENFPEAIDGIQAGGGSSVSPKDVNFYDYDGTLLHSYTVEEAQALTELPPLPEREGLICQGWNWTLANIKSVNGAVDAGATYITDDGKTRLYISIPNEDRLKLPLYFYQSVANGVTIDWGDGSATQTLSSTGHLNTTHTYASKGDYIITLEVTSGDCYLGSNNYCILGVPQTTGKAYAYSHMLKKLEIGSGVSTIYQAGLLGCVSLESITMPIGLKNVKNSAFENCFSLSCMVIPEGLTSFAEKTCYYCTSLKVVSFPYTFVGGDEYCFGYCTSLSRIAHQKGSIYSYYFVACRALSDVTLRGGTWIVVSAFSGAHSLTRLKIPKSVNQFGNNAFDGCGSMKVIDLTSHTAVPTCQSSSFSGTPSDCEIWVPAALYDQWIAATNWSYAASKIVAK